MSDLDKVIKGLEICIDRVPGKYTCNECPYEIDGNFCEINLAKEALILLKEQPQIIRCKDCKYQIDRGRRYKDCNMHFLQAKDDWFCADGKRR